MLELRSGGKVKQAEVWWWVEMVVVAREINLGGPKDCLSIDEVICMSLTIVITVCNSSKWTLAVSLV
jgi:hypothetical protein